MRKEKATTDKCIYKIYIDITYTSHLIKSCISTKTEVTTGYIVADGT